jgi:hypothetical protein
LIEERKIEKKKVEKKKALPFPMLRALCVTKSKKEMISFSWYLGIWAPEVIRKLYES